MATIEERKNWIEALITGRGGEKLWDAFLERLEEYLVDNGAGADIEDIEYAIEVLAKAYIIPGQ